MRSVAKAKTVIVPKSIITLLAIVVALAALLVQPPTSPVLAAIRAILKLHNALEEDPQTCRSEAAALAGAEIDETCANYKTHRI